MRTVCTLSPPPEAHCLVPTSLLGAALPPLPSSVRGAPCSPCLPWAASSLRMRERCPICPSLCERSSRRAAAGSPEAPRRPHQTTTGAGPGLGASPTHLPTHLLLQGLESAHWTGAPRPAWVSPTVPQTLCSDPGPGTDFWNQPSRPQHPQWNNARAAGEELNGGGGWGWGLHSTGLGSLALGGGREQGYGCSKRPGSGGASG